MAIRLGMAWPSGEGQGLTVVWREFNPSTTRSCITEAFSLQIKPVSKTAVIHYGNIVPQGLREALKQTPPIIKRRQALKRQT